MSIQGVIYAVCAVLVAVAVGVNHGAPDAVMALLMLVLGGAIMEDIHDHNDDHRSDQ